MQPVVSIVGRPNVGKSTIFNRLVGAREAIVDDAYGVTRDRHYGDAYWNGRDFTVIDTGGYLPDEMDVMIRGIREQVHVALEESDVVLFVVDVHAGINTLDRAVAELLRQQQKPVMLVANKADNEQRRLEASEFYELGLEELFPISAASGSGTGELLDRLVELLPDHKTGEAPKRPQLAIVGRPNVGKSSLVNALLNSERCIVTDIPGTTRDSVNSLLKYKDREYELVDTAGLRKKARVRENIEFYSTVRTDRAIRQCDVVILMVDAMQGFEEQDKRILREAARFNKGLVLVLNKWDLVPDKEPNLVKRFEEYVRGRIPMMEYVPIITASSLNRQRIYQIIDLAQKVIDERAKKIKTSKFNDFLKDVLKERPLPVKRGKRLKILYGTQVKVNPPVFKFFMNEPEELPPNYRRFLEHKIRERYQFTGVPITMTFKRRN